MSGWGAERERERKSRNTHFDKWFQLTLIWLYRIFKREEESVCVLRTLATQFIHDDDTDRTTDNINTNFTCASAHHTQSIMRKFNYTFVFGLPFLLRRLCHSSFIVWIRWEPVDGIGTVRKHLFPFPSMPFYFRVLIVPSIAVTFNWRNERQNTIDYMSISIDAHRTCEAKIFFSAFSWWMWHILTSHPHTEQSECGPRNRSTDSKAECACVCGTVRSMELSYLDFTTQRHSTEDTYIAPVCGVRIAFDIPRLCAAALRTHTKWNSKSLFHPQ